MNILITGGCGFVGVNLVKYLSGNDYTITILDNLSTGEKDYIEKLSLEKAPNIIIDDIRNEDAVARAVKGMDTVIHLAAQTSVVDSIENPRESWDINVTGTVNLLEACRQNNVERFVFASSNAVAGEQVPPIDEKMIPQPLSPYGASKLTGEALCSAYYHSFGLKTIALRFANLYGPYSDHKTSVIAKFIEWIKAENPFTVFGDGNQTRDFVHVDDISQAIQLSLESQKSQGEVFQIASGKETSINDLIEILSEAVEKQLQVNYKPGRKGEITRNYSDISKARKMLDFEPKIELKEGLKRLL
ncbi:MAG: GDP-mannose 4,6-dehydratase [Chloroflexi bacterium]|nr:GDP-mannose 4,6-dehydratase [Chloroflexota bacterium]